MSNLIIWHDVGFSRRASVAKNTVLVILRRNNSIRHGKNATAKLGLIFLRSAIKIISEIHQKNQ